MLLVAEVNEHLRLDVPEEELFGNRETQRAPEHPACRHPCRSFCEDPDRIGRYAPAILRVASRIQGKKPDVVF